MSTVRATGWTGWIIFAGVVLLIGGIFGIVQGLVAVIGPNSYYIVSDGSLWLFNVAGWGWWNLIVGILVVLTAIALMAGQTWARIIAIILVIINAVSQLLLVTAQPWWSIIMIAIDLLVVYALIVHGRELRSES